MPPTQSPMPLPQFMELFNALNIQTNNPVHAANIGEVSKLVAWANALLNAGRAQIVIKELSTRQDLDQSDCALHILGNAHKYRGDPGDLTQAESLLRRALALRRESLKASPSDLTCTAVASTLSVLGEVAFIQGDRERADALFVEAITVKPNFGPAHQCRLCMRSVAQDGAGCEAVLVDLDRAYPNWRSDNELVQTMHDDGMLDWFRSQPHLFSAVTQH